MKGGANTAERWDKTWGCTEHDYTGEGQKRIGRDEKRNKTVKTKKKPGGKQGRDKKKTAISAWVF